VKVMLRESWMLAVEALSWMEIRRLSEPLALSRTAKQLGVTDSDALRLAHHLVYETVRRQNLIDKFVGTVIGQDVLGECSMGVQQFLRLYVYQTRAARNWSPGDVEEAEAIVRLARSFLGWQTFCDVEPFFGLLLTQSDAAVFEGTNDEERVGFRTFHPRGYVEHCFRQFGRVSALDVLEADLRPPPTYVRLNTLKAAEDEILENLTADGVKLEKIEQLKHTRRVISAKKPLVSLKSYREGFFFIQDLASCFAVEVAGPSEGIIVLDVCASPGAKTTYLAQLMNNTGRIVSVDFSERRMGVWKNERERMGVENAEPVVADARNPLPLTVEADVVILDPPCTSTGTFGKLPSAKWRLARHSVENMAEVQWQLLNNCVRYVKPGGTLVYSTCSITVEENEMLIERLLKWNTDFSLQDIEPMIGLPGLRGLQNCRRLYPHLNGCNGFFIAKLAKAGSD
jgi:16S rRNA (cytosine967-C5)-methyltransferase